MIRLAVRVGRGRADVVLAELLELAPAGVEEVLLEDGRIEYAVYGAPGELPSLPDLDALAGSAAVEITTSEIADDWNERWKDFHKPVHVTLPIEGRDSRETSHAPAIRVRPPWEPQAQDPDEAVELVIDPGQAFGTGGHASTRLCLGLLLELRAADQSGLAVLDVGTGSGVLAIAAAKIGFGPPLLGLDNELQSVEAAAANAAANGVELATARYDLRSGGLPWLGPAPEAAAPEPSRTLVLANLLRPLLLGLSAAIARTPAALIAGGLLAGELDAIATAFAERHGMCERTRRVEGDWGALLLAAPARR